MKPIALDARINSIGPKKFRKLGSGGGVDRIHQEIPHNNGKMRMKLKKKKSQKNTMMFRKKNEKTEK